MSPASRCSCGRPRRRRGRLLFGQRRPGRAARVRPARHPALHAELPRRVRARGRRPVRRRVRRGPHAQPVHRLQRPAQVLRPARARSSLRAPTSSRPATTRGSSATATARRGSRAASIPPRTSPTSSTGSLATQTRPRAVPGRRAAQDRRSARSPSASASHVAEKPDSQEVCFALGGRARGGRRESGARGAGARRDRRARRATCWATHDGIADYTVGQRKGLGVAAATPLYVARGRRGRTTGSWSGERERARGHARRGR